MLKHQCFGPFFPYRPELEASSVLFLRNLKIGNGKANENKKPHKFKTTLKYYWASEQKHTPNFS